MLYPYQIDYYKEGSEYIKSKIDFKPEIGIILGTALGSLAEKVENPVIILYDEIPGFLSCTVKISHDGKLILGKLNGKYVAIMSGRFHYYEGYEFEQLVIPVRMLKLIGVEKLILTNIAGAVKESYKPGDIVILRDHIKLMGASPIRGPHYKEEFGPKCFDVCEMYTPELRELAKECANELGIGIQEGVYYYFAGPQLETPSEIKAIRALGADVTGMSTVTEALTAAHCGMPVLALSFMSNMAAGMDKTILMADARELARSKAPEFRSLVCKIVERM